MPDQNSVDAVLAALPDQLAKEYPRAAHRGRHEQIAAHVTMLRHLVNQLPDEEEREAEYEARLMESYRGGRWKQPSDPHTHNDDAALRLSDALARNGG